MAMDPAIGLDCGVKEFQKCGKVKFSHSRLTQPPYLHLNIEYINSSKTFLYFICVVGCSNKPFLDIKIALPFNFPRNSIFPSNIDSRAGDPLSKHITLPRPTCRSPLHIPIRRASHQMKCSVSNLRGVALHEGSF